jgi:hypothetical protein
MRYFTKKFTSYAIAVYEKKFKKEPMDLIDVGNLSIDKMITAIRVGNGVKGGDFILSEEEAAEKIDNFLEDENNSIIDVYLQIMEEYDRDLKIFKGTGVTIDSIRKDLYSKVEDKTKTADVVEFPKAEEPKNELLPGETPKVDVNGNVTLDSEDVPTEF